MQFALALLVVVLVAGCSSKQPQENDIVTKLGIVSAKEEVEVSEVESETSGNTVFFGGISSGGGFSIGVGSQSSPGSSSKTRKSMRYEVELSEGGQMSVYHDSHDFEVGDCVEVTVNSTDNENPPGMQRVEDGC